MNLPRRRFLHLAASVATVLTILLVLWPDLARSQGKPEFIAETTLSRSSIVRTLPL